MRYLLLLVVFLPMASFAVDDSETMEDPALQARYESLTRELRCLVCQNESIADSNAPLASDLRRQVREMLREGASNREIYTYMTDRYGDFVLYRPPFVRRTWLLWFAPALLLMLGGTVLIRTVRRRANLPIDDDEAEETIE